VAIFRRATSERDLLARVLSGRSFLLRGLVDVYTDIAGGRSVE
jgi:hypothetical protein